MEMSDAGMDYLHPTSFRRGNFNHQLFICGFPSSHLMIIVNKGLDIFDNVAHLPIPCGGRGRTQLP